MNKENYEGLRKQLDNGSLDIPSQITILEIAYNLEHQLQAYKDKEDKIKEYCETIKEKYKFFDKSNTTDVSAILEIIGDDKNE